MFSILWANSFYEIELLTPPPTFNLEGRQISLMLLTLRPVCVTADSNLSNFTLQNASVSLRVIYANLGPSKVGVHEKICQTLSQNRLSTRNLRRKTGRQSYVMEIKRSRRIQWVLHVVRTNRARFPRVTPRSKPSCKTKPSWAMGWSWLSSVK